MVHTMSQRSSTSGVTKAPVNCVCLGRMPLSPSPVPGCLHGGESMAERPQHSPSFTGPCFAVQ